MAHQYSLSLGNIQLNFIKVTINMPIKKVNQIKYKYAEFREPTQLPDARAKSVLSNISSIFLKVKSIIDQSCS